MTDLVLSGSNVQEDMHAPSIQGGIYTASSVHLHILTHPAPHNTMGLMFTVEAWILSIFGWIWLTIQNIWMPSLLCSYVYYAFLLLSTWHLIISSIFVDARQPSVAYFNSVLGICLFTASCITDTITTYTFGGEEYQPVQDTSGCCANCNIAKANQILFFGDTPLYLAQAGILTGYLLIHLILAGAQVLDIPPQASITSRTVWSGTSWGITLGALLASRFVIMFDGSTVTLVPESVFYLLLFSQPLLTLSIIYWLFMEAFFVLMVLEGIPQLTLTAFRIVRSVTFGITMGFAIVSGIVFGLRGMLTVPLFLTLCLLVISSVIGMVEAFLGRLPETTGGNMMGYSRRVATTTRGQTSFQQRSSVVVTPQSTSSGSSTSHRMSRHYIPVPIQMPTPGKKAL
jgi:hypothetical protein